MKYNQELPEEVELKLTAYIKRIKAIKWFQPAKDLKKEVVEKQVNVALEALGIKANIEYRLLKTPQDFGAAREAAWGAAWGVARDAAWGAAWNAARDAALDAVRGADREAALGAAWDAARGVAWDAVLGAARGASWDAAWGASWGAAWGAVDSLVEDLPIYKEKYPKDSFINFIPLYEMGLYPIGIVNGNFVVAVPTNKLEFPDDFYEL